MASLFGVTEGEFVTWDREQDVRRDHFQRWAPEVEPVSAFPGSVMVLSPWRPFEDAVYGDHVVHTVGRLSDLGELSALTEEQRRARLERVVGHLLSREGPLLTNRERGLLVRRVVDEALGLGVLEPLLRDETITEIMVNGADNIYVERSGRIQRLPVKFSSEEQVYQAIDRIVETAIYLQAESRRLAKAQCARHNITATQLSVLKLLVEIGDLSLSELSKQMAARNSTITGIIDRMVAAELVKRVRSEDDRRVWHIQLLDRGRSIAESVDMAPWDLVRNSLHSLPRQEVSQLITILTKLATHVEEAVRNADPGTQ